MSKLKVLSLVAVGLLALVAIGAAGLVGYAAATAEDRLMFPDTPEPAIVASSDPEVVARGRYLVHGPAHCAQCHSTDDRSRPELIATTPLQGGLSFEMGPIATRYARNLTSDEETGLGRFTDGQIARAIRAGVMPDGQLSIFMRMSVGELSDEDLTAVVSYLRSLEPVRNEVPKGEFYLFGKVLFTYAFPPFAPRATPPPAHVPASEEPDLARGEYLADKVMLCTACHTRTDMGTFQPTGPKAGGSHPEPSHGPDDDMEFVAPNLTSHPTGVTGRLDEDAFVARFRAGRVFASSIMPWENFANVTDSDLRSVYRYLRSLPPVDADLGPTYRKIGWRPDAG